MCLVRVHTMEHSDEITVKVPAITAKIHTPFLAMIPMNSIPVTVVMISICHGIFFRWVSKYTPKIGDRSPASRVPTTVM